MRTSTDDDSTDGACAFAHHLHARAVEDQAVPEALFGDVALEDACKLVAPSKVEQEPGRVGRLLRDRFGQAVEMVWSHEEQCRGRNAVGTGGTQVLHSSEDGA